MTTSFVRDYAQSAQGVVYRLKELMTGAAGWKLADTISDTLQSRDYVLYSTASGEDIEGNPVGGIFCVRITASGTGYIELRGYDDCQDVLGTIVYNGEIYDPVYSRVLCPSGETKFWAFADAYHTKFAVLEPTTSYCYHGYVGLIDTTYLSGNDLYPLLVFGTHNYNSHWGDCASTVMRTVSGTVGRYSSWISQYYSYGDTDRANVAAGIKPILFCSGTEVRGTPKGVYRITTTCAGDGVEYVMSDGLYYAFMKSGVNNYSYLYGPAPGGLGCYT